MPFFNRCLGLISSDSASLQCPKWFENWITKELPSTYAYQWRSLVPSLGVFIIWNQQIGGTKQGMKRQQCFECMLKIKTNDAMELEVVRSVAHSIRNLYMGQHFGREAERCNNIGGSKKWHGVRLDTGVTASGSFSLCVCLESGASQPHTRKNVWA